MINKIQGDEMKIVIFNPLLNGSETHLQISKEKRGLYTVKLERYTRGYLESKYSLTLTCYSDDLNKDLGSLTEDQARGYYDNGNKIDFKTLVF